MEWIILVDDETGEIDTLWNDDICLPLLQVSEVEPDEISVRRVGDVEYDPRKGWVVTDHQTGEPLTQTTYFSRDRAVQAEQKALFERMKSKPLKKKKERHEGDTYW